MSRQEITPDLLMQAYAMGIFPMSEHKDDPEIFWVDPKQRGILPLGRFHISRSLAKALRRGDYEVTLNRDFEGVLDACADRPDTWINDRIRSLYIDLHQKSQAHSLEVWREGRLIGGVYGVALGAAFFGESMFSRATNGSKIALAFLTTHLRNCGYTLFDTQFITDHLASLGAKEIPRADYQFLLKDAIHRRADITGAQLPDVSSVLASATAAST
ncbi:leucyl/phenylalanyl-tRNA--protein transferase [Cognatishimia activa]|uniref:Leucyl/phenylalanyl-tRNA--protein transferase n=1 Tax=Cognatishimia activa TaxID=1715691 RepID=A0A975ERS8_9RHOB|nr:leucyl/phenylalanyl-tRNA--protein transferase [Cognatishimia activa]QTN35961.1 leucyl/phenylalanyl-tRNA--protein transferase [Cognatishimia activa]